MTSKRRPLAALALIAVVAPISGCGSGSPAQTTGSTGTDSITNSASATTTSTESVASVTGTSGNTVSKREKEVKFAECMRSNGVPDFPDPNANGEFMYGVSVTPAVFTRAVEACKSLEPPGSLSGQRSFKQQSLALKFAECVRKNGVPDFPDPANGQPLIDTTKIPSSNSPNGMNILNAATHKCGPVLQLSARGGTG